MTPCKCVTTPYRPHKPCIVHSRGSLLGSPKKGQYKIIIAFIGYILWVIIIIQSTLHFFVHLYLYMYMLDLFIQYKIFFYIFYLREMNCIIFDHFEGDSLALTIVDYSIQHCKTGLVYILLM